MSEIIKTETRESDLDREFAVSCFDYFIDLHQQGKITYLEAVDAYTSVILDMVRQDHPDE